MTRAETTPCPDLKGWYADRATPDAETLHQMHGLWEPVEVLTPVCMTGTLAGSVVDRCGLPVLARVVVRDRTHTLASEGYTCSPRAGGVAGRYEIRRLPAGTYSVTILAAGFAPEVRYGIRVEASQLTDLGRVRLMPVNSPSITLPPRREEVPPSLPLAA